MLRALATPHREQTMKMFRKRIAAAVLTLALCTALVACADDDSGGGSGSGSGQQSLSLGVQEKYASFLLEIALQQGYLDGSGINGVKTTLFTDLPAMFAAVQKGQIELGMQTIPALDAFNKSTSGDQLKLVQQVGNVTRWYSRTGLQLPTGKNADWQQVVKSWKGLTIGVPAIGSFMDRWLRFMLVKVGLSPDKDVKIAVVGVQTSAAALKQGTVDLVGVTSGGAAAIEKQGVGEFALDYPSGPPEFQNILVSVYFAAETALGQNAKRYSDIAGAMEKAREFVADPANKDVCVKILSEKVGMDPVIAENVYAIDHDGVAGTTLSEATYGKTVSTFASIGLLGKPTPAFGDFVSVATLPKS